MAETGFHSQMLRERIKGQCPVRLQQKTPEGQADVHVDEETELLDYFVHPQHLDVFFSYHPQQPTKQSRLLHVFHNKHGTNHKWLTYSEKNSVTVLLCVLGICI